MTSKKTTPKKTDALTLRLNPKQKYLIELCARQGHQSITVVVEQAVNELASRRKIPTDGDELSLRLSLDYYWSPDESERVVNLVFFMPSLITHEESCIKTVLIDAMDIFLNFHEVSSKEDFEYRSHLHAPKRGVMISGEDGAMLFVSPRRKHIKLCWDLITERAGHLAANGSYKPITVEDAESFIGRPLSSIHPAIKTYNDGYDEEGGSVASFSADAEMADLTNNLLGKS